VVGRRGYILARRLTRLNTHFFRQNRSRAILNILETLMSANYQWLVQPHIGSLDNVQGAIAWVDCKRIRRPQECKQDSSFTYERMRARGHKSMHESRRIVTDYYYQW
jgi:hypothetical protein